MGSLLESRSAPLLRTLDSDLLKISKTYCSKFCSFKVYGLSESATVVLVLLNEGRVYVV